MMYSFESLKISIKVETVASLCLKQKKSVCCNSLILDMRKMSGISEELGSSGMSNR